jgi:molecular chaperone HtpG
MSEKTANVKEFEFQAEVQKLLHLLASSLYTHKEIFIRELVSNASDALNKMRFNLLTSKDVLNAELELDIKIHFDKEKNTLTISDTGIGMNDEELKANLGTIAKSGSLDFITEMKDKAKDPLDIIGQFGVGFYSAFMVADKISVLSKSYKKGSKAYLWESDGSGKYTLGEAEKSTRGTDIIIHLKESEKEYCESFRVESVIKKYSSFVSFPIFVENNQVNTTSALWRRSKSDVKDEEYKEFYKFLTNDFQEPMFHMHFSAEGTAQFKALLFVPQNNMEVMGFSSAEHGLSLYTNNVLIQAECEHLMPKYLRFVRGVVDSEDVPLNVSRESIQDDINIRRIKKVVMNKFLSHLGEMADNDKELYTKFFGEYGRMLKEGVSQDFEYKDKLKELLRFNSSLGKDDNELISLKEYVSKMKEGQKEIYYSSGPSLQSIKQSPHLEIFTKKEIPVLFLTDPLDDLVMSNIMEYEGKSLKPADQANLELFKEEDKGEEKKEEGNDAGDKSFSDLLAKIKVVLKDKVKDAVISKRLTDSPCVLVNPDGSMSSHMQKVLKAVNKDFNITSKILEINKDHELIKNLSEIITSRKDDLYADEIINLLFDSAMLMDGYLDNPMDTVKRINRVMETSSKYIKGK